MTGRAEFLTKIKEIQKEILMMTEFIQELEDCF